MPFRGWVALVLLVGGIGGAGYTHWMLQNQMIAQQDQATSYASEAYSNAIKSELEASRLGPALSLMKIAPSPENSAVLLNALDTVYARHNLISRAAAFQPIREYPEFRDLLAQMRISLDVMDEAIGVSTVDFSTAWKAQAELAVFFNEVSRYALENRARTEANRMRDLERFAWTCATYNMLSLASMATGGLLLLTVLLGRRQRDPASERYELV